MRRVKRVAPDGGGEEGGHARDVEALCEAFLQLDTAEECRRFLRDLCTPAEISALAERWKIARILHEDRMSYREIHDLTGVSLATITRVARFLREESYHGYRAVIDKLKAKKKRKSDRT